MRRLRTFGPSLLLCTVVTAARGQPPSSDSARCAAEFNAPSADTAVIELQAIFSSFDTTRKIPASYRDILGAGLHEMFVAPRPLIVDTFDPRAAPLVRDAGSRLYATVSLRSFYRLTLHRDGRLTNVRAVGGVRNRTFDDAVVAALVRLDSSRTLPDPRSFRFDDSFDRDELELHLVITEGSVTSTRVPSPSPAAGGVTPLFRLVAPIYPVSRDVAPLANNPVPHYPDSMRSQLIEGEVQAEMLVRPDSTVDPRSIHFGEVTSLEFANAVLEVLPRMRFSPLQIAGCSVASLRQMPFIFSLNR
jgi:hypothetical protein